MTMKLLREIKDSLLHLTFPHICEGCCSDLLDKDQSLWMHCLSLLPQTAFHLHPNNPVEEIFWGRLPIVNAMAQYYFTKESLMQRLMHRFKYRSNKELCWFLGRLMGYALIESSRFQIADVLVPLPLFPEKERKRGYNQAAILCEGIAEVMQKPILKNAIIRTHNTESQTKKTRIERWQNMEGRFEVIDAEGIRGKHVLLVDDVVTTGATLEACGRAIVQAPEVRISIATLCFSSES